MNKFIFAIVLISTIFCLALAAESDVTERLIESKIIPEFVSEEGAELLKVSFDTGVSAELGNEITPFQARDIPALDWPAEEGAFYTIVVFDPDAPSPGTNFLSELLTWSVGNIPRKDIALGKTLAEYFAASPPKGAKLNRIIYLVYKQPGEVEFDEKPIDKYTIDGRSHFSVNDFAAKYGFGNPVAVNYYLTKYDFYVDKVYAQLNCCFELNSPEYQYS